MSALSSDFYPPSNRRRCVKGRPSYTEPSDNILISESVNHDFNSNDSYCQNEYSALDAMQSEDAEEEPITIDLSAFLNENPLLAQSAFESSAENNVASTESSSQFRVTDCETKPSEVHKASGIDEACSADVINSTVINSVTNDNVEALAVKAMVSPVLETAKENCLATDEIFASNSVNENITSSDTSISFHSVPSRDIIFNGKKTPVKKFTKAKPLGLSNPLKKYKNFMKSKDLNKTNEKVFGKYPVVKCEKLDIENFVKNNKIKVSNWPLHHTESPKSNKSFNRNLTNKRLGLNKVSLKPKLMGSLKPKLIRKPINFNKFLGNFSKKANNVRGMFDSLNPVSKPVIIRTDSWKPEIANSSAHIPTFFKNLIKAPTVSPKPALDLLKLNVLNDQTVNYNAFTSPEKEIIEKIKGPIVTNVNKFCKSAKNYQRIAPKPIVISPEVTNIVPCLAKPVVETLTEPVSNEYTVIEPYVEDPSSPQKPKPILTVPIEVISSPEKQNIILHSTPITKAENTEKIKTVKSVFLNGTIKQISVPTKIKNDLSAKRIPVIKRSVPSKRKSNQKKVLEQGTIELCIKEKDEISEEDANVLQAKNVVVDAMQNALGQNIKKTKPKAMKKEPYESKSDISLLGSSYSSVLGSSSYNSILNDFIMSGFNDFEESNFQEADSENVSSPVLMTSEASIKVKDVAQNPSKISKGKNNNKRKKYANDSPQTSDTLSASECEDEKESRNVLKEKISLKRKKLVTSSKGVLEAVNSETTSEFSKSSLKPDILPHISNNSSNSTNLNFENNKNFDSNPVDSSHSFSQLENTLTSVSHTEINNDTFTSSDSHKFPDICNPSMDDTLSDNNESSLQNKIPKEKSNLVKQETSTRTLRERKCSSTEVDKFSDNSSKQTQNNKHSFEKTKSVKGTINSKLKIQKKTPPRSTAKVKIKRKSCKSEDIIREINTITGGHLNLKKRYKNCKEPDLNDNTQNSNLLNINSKKDDSESNSSTTFRWNRLSSRSFPKRKRTLKVRIKHCRKRNGASCLPLSSLPDVLENSNSASSLSKNNLSLHSSFREGKVGKKGTLLKEENSSEYSASISECNMEVVETDEKCPVEEHLPAVFTHNDLRVNSSEASVSQDASNVINSDVSNTMCDTFLDESLNDKSNLLNTSLDERDESESVKNEEEKSSTMSLNDNQSENIKVGETNGNMTIEKTDAIITESYVESSSEMSKVNQKPISIECETAISNSNVEPDADILTQHDKNEAVMDLKESIEITKVSDCKNISEIGTEDTSNIASSSSIIICENSLDRVEDFTKQENEIIKDSVEMDSSENISQVDNISLLENVSSPKIVNEKDEIKNTFEVHKNINEKSGIETDPENLNKVGNIDSNKNESNNNANICINSDDKSQNIQLLYSETSDTEQNVISPEEHKLNNSEESDSVEPKKCPKIKISFIKNSGDSPDSTRNWFVSESKPTDESTHSISDIKVPKTAVDSVSIIGVNQDVGLNSNSNSSHHVERNFNVIVSESSQSVDDKLVCDTNISLTNDKSLNDYKLTSVKTTIAKDDSQLTDVCQTKDMPLDSSLPDHDLSHDDILDKDLVEERIPSTFFDDNPLIDLNDTSIRDLPTEKVDSSFFDNPLSDINDMSDKDVPLEKVNISFSEDNPLADIDKILSKDISSKNIHTSLSDNNSCVDILTKDTNAKNVLYSVSSVSIKEEPLDEEDDIVMKSNLTDLNSCVKSEDSQLVSEVKKRKRGRPRTVTTNKISCSNVKVSDVREKESSTPVTPKSKGQKKKVVPSPASTPSTGRKKNYDAELVRVPFSMGWMREHVIRATGKDDKRPSDIYYFTPDGTKLRSMPDIGTYLSKHPDIKLTLKNFTFAKELIYREPFEIERDARQMVKKVVVAKKKTSLKSPGKAVDSPSSVKGNSISQTSSDNKKHDKSLSENILPSADSKMKTVSKRKSSLSNDSTFYLYQKDKSVNHSKVSKNSKQKTIDDYLNSDCHSVKKSTRSSRKIVKKVPFDNSFENKVSKKPKTTEQRNSSDRIKLNSKNVAEKCDSRTEEVLVNKTDSLIVHFPKIVNEREHLGKKSIDSSSFTVTKSNELIINKPSTTNSSGQLCPVRTSNKSSKIQNNLKVKPVSRKFGIVLHKPCTKFCNFAYSREPSVMCSICLCLFHPECIPFKPSGDVKYACVPCVKTEVNVLEEESSNAYLPEIDIGILYPFVSLHIVPDPAFDAAFNKFYSPVDQSFVQSCEENNCQLLQISGVQPIHTYPHNVPNCCVTDKDSLSNLYLNKSNSNLWYPPMCYDRTDLSTSADLPFLMPTNPFKRNASNNSNHFSDNSTMSNFQNPQKSHDHEQFRNAPLLNLQASFQSTFHQKLNCDNLYSGCVLDPFSRHQEILKMIPMSSRQCHISETPANESDSSNIYPDLGLSSNSSLLQSMLQMNRYCEKFHSNMTVLRKENCSSSTGSLKKLKLGEVSTASNILQADTNSNLIHKSDTIQDGTSEFLSLNKKYLSYTEVNAASESAVQKKVCKVDNSKKRKRKNDCSEDSSHKDNSKRPKNKKTIKNKISQNPSNFLGDKEKKIVASKNYATLDTSKFTAVNECLNLIFKFLNVHDLLCASLVSKNWRLISFQKHLWENVTFSGLAVKDWGKCCSTLQKNETKYIDFRGIQEQDLIFAWKSFAKHLHLLGKVEELIFEKVPPFVINKIADDLPQLKKLTCYCLTSVFTEPEIWSTPCEFKLSTLRYLGRLEALKISSMGGIILKDEQQSLMPYLPNLTHVVLTGFKFNSHINLESLSQQKQLLSLELGDCIDIEPQIYGLLSKLINLQNLCLQNGGCISDSKLAEALSKLKRLGRLELMNFQISCHLPNVLKKMRKLQHLSIWPDNRIEAAQVNFNSYCAATSCTNLKSICWGILIDDDDKVPNTLELQDNATVGSKVEKLSFQELFQALVKHYPGVKVEVKCLPRSIWSEFCSSRSFT